MKWLRHKKHSRGKPRREVVWAYGWERYKCCATVREPNITTYGSSCSSPGTLYVQMESSLNWACVAWREKIPNIIQSRQEGKRARRLRLRCLYTQFLPVVFLCVAYGGGIYPWLTCTTRLVSIPTHSKSSSSFSLFFRHYFRLNDYGWRKRRRKSWRDVNKEKKCWG